MDIYRSKISERMIESLIKHNRTVKWKKNKSHSSLVRFRINGNSMLNRKKNINFVVPSDLNELWKDAIAQYILENEIQWEDISFTDEVGSEYVVWVAAILVLAFLIIWQIVFWADDSYNEHSLF